MKRRRELTILCRNRKCRNPIKMIATLDISYYHTRDREDIYNVSVDVVPSVQDKSCKKCGRKVVIIGPLIGSVV